MGLFEIVWNCLFSSLPSCSAPLVWGGHILRYVSFTEFREGSLRMDFRTSNYHLLLHFCYYYFIYTILFFKTFSLQIVSWENFTCHNHLLLSIFSAITNLLVAPLQSTPHLPCLSNALPVTMYLVYYHRVGTRSILLQTRLGKSDISSPDALLDLIGTMNYEHRNTHFWLGGGGGTLLHTTCSCHTSIVVYHHTMYITESIWNKKQKKWGYFR